MSSIKVLALSSSRVGNSAYLEGAVPFVKSFLGSTALNIAFIPFASADNDYEAYAEKVKEGLRSLGYNISTVHPHNAKQIIEQCDAIMVGGGNTFKLLHDIYDHDLFELIQNKVHDGTPYVGWSAGSNITGLTLSTTNDMPIIEPKSFKAFGFFPFQINPHYLNVKPEGHNGETRDERLLEFLKLNPTIPIVGLPEGTALLLNNETITLVGDHPAVIFKTQNDKPIKEDIRVREDLSFLLK